MDIFTLITPFALSTPSNINKATQAFVCSGTNQCDVSVTSQICNTVFYVSIVIGLTVIICFIASLVFKYSTHKAELDEKNSARKNEEESRKNAQNEKSLQADSDYKTFEKLIQKANEGSTFNREINVTYKNGPNSISIKSLHPEEVSKSKNA